MYKQEIIIGLVAPMGCDKSFFLRTIKDCFEKKDYQVSEIKVTDLLYKNLEDYPHSFDIFCKMQICSELRLKYRGFIAALIIDAIRTQRKHQNKNNKIIYLIDQIKNEAEYEILSHVYGVNYLQISLFSNYYERDKNLKNKLSSDKIDLKKLTGIKNKKFLNEILLDAFSSKNFKKKKLALKLKGLETKVFENYEEQILNDCSHMLIEKDNNEIDPKYKKSGQQIAKLFHKSHYFINLDSKKSFLLKEIQKFIDQLFGEYKEYPTQDEFGMTLAYHASFRSNFPGDRHIGASIIAENGEVISLGSIRAPSGSSNPNLAHQDSITEGYEHYYSKISKWKNELKADECNLKSKEDIYSFLSDSIDFHPCTHAEIAAIIDAAKLGVTVKNSTLYSTTFPCHLCAKDIVTAGIKKVVFLEAYPKSKSKALYPKILDLNSQQSKDIIPFETYIGVSPSRYHYVYAIKNKPKFSIENDQSITSLSNSNTSPYLEFICSKYYKKQESDVINHFSDYINNGKNEQDCLFSLLKGSK